MLGRYTEAAVKLFAAGCDAARTVLRARADEHVFCCRVAHLKTQNNALEHHVAAGFQAVLRSAALVDVVKSHVCHGKVDAVMLALAEVFRFDLFPLVIEQDERAHELFVNAHLRRVHIRAEGIFKLRAEEIAHLLLHKRFQLFLSTAAEKQCGTHTAEEQNRHENRFEYYIINREKRDNSAQNADQTDDRPDACLLLILTQLF